MTRIHLMVFVVFFVACTNNSKVPKDVIPQEEMKRIMWDMVQADRFVSEFVDKPGDTIDNRADGFKVYEQVFKLHGISREDFLNSYKFYLGRPDLTRTMFDSISAQAERRKAEVYANPKADSLRAKLDSLKKKNLIK